MIVLMHFFYRRRHNPRLQVRLPFYFEDITFVDTCMLVVVVVVVHVNLIFNL